MITVNDINKTNVSLSYVTDENICIQFDFDGKVKDGKVTYDISKEKLDDAAMQFVSILNIATWDENLGKAIEKHMSINGYDGVAKCYKL